MVKREKKKILAIFKRKRNTKMTKMKYETKQLFIKCVFSCVIVRYFFSIARTLSFSPIFQRYATHGYTWNQCTLTICVCAGGVLCKTFHQSVWYFQFSIIFLLSWMLFDNISYSETGKNKKTRIVSDSLLLSHYIAIFLSFLPCTKQTVPKTHLL